MKRTILAILLAIALGVCGTWAAVPQTISYQGVLTDGAGTAVPDGPYNLTFKIYNVPSVGTDLWVETQNAVQVTGGIFNVILGSVAPIDLDFDVPYWLGVSVNGGAELTPRTRLTSSPYSLNAKAVFGTYNVFPDSGDVGVGLTGPSYPLHVSTTELRGIRLDGSPATWSLLSINGAYPGIEYCRSGSYVAKHYITASNSWQLDVGADLALFAQGGTANVGIGISTPAEKLDVDGAIKIGTTATTNAGTMRWTGSDFEGYDGSIWKSLTAAGGGLPSGSSGETLRNNGSDWVANNALTNDGSIIGIGTPSLSGDLRLYRSGVSGMVLRANSDSYGGQIYLYDNNGYYTGWMAADEEAAGGGDLYIQRDTGNTGFYVEGNWAGSQEPGVGIMGSARSVAFNMNNSGDASVSLPADAISASEVLDEPGTASATSSVGVSLNGSLQTLLSRTITVPASGYVLAIGSAQASIMGDASNASFVNFGVSDDNASFPVNQQVLAGVPSGAVAGWYWFPVTVHGLFTVSAGSNTFYFLAQKTAAATSAWAYDMQFTLLYIPTSYGTVSPTLATGENVPDDQKPKTFGLTATDIASEQVESQRANQERIDKELADMRAKLNALEENLRREKER